MRYWAPNMTNSTLNITANTSMTCPVHSECNCDSDRGVGSCNTSTCAESWARFVHCVEDAEEVLRLFGASPTVLAARRRVNFGGSQSSRQLLLSGAHLGVTASSASGRVGGSAIVSSTWVSDSALSVRLAAAVVGSSLRAVITSGPCCSHSVLHGGCQGGQASLSEAVSYDSVSTSSINRVNAPTTGNVPLIIWGGGLSTSDYSPSLRVLAMHGQENFRSALWRSTSALECRVPGGYGAGLSLVLQVGASTATVTTAFSYDAPIITAILPARVATSGAEYMWLSGHNFGRLPDVQLYCQELEYNGRKQRVCDNYGYRGTLLPDISVGQTACREAKWINSHTLRCLGVAAGVGHSLVVRATIAAQVAFLTQAASYHAPDLAEVTPHALLGDSSANALLTITGSHLGLTDSSVQARVGHTGAESTLHWSDSSLLCRVASGAGRALGVAVTVGTDCGWNTECGRGVFSSNLCGPAHTLCAGPLTIPIGGHADGDVCVCVCVHICAVR